MQKCYATAPGKDDIYVALTAEEEAARLADIAKFGSPEYREMLLDATADNLLEKAVAMTFLDSFWLVFKKIAPVGIVAIDNAVAADDRAAFNQFFKDQVKTKS